MLFSEMLSQERKEGHEAGRIEGHRTGLREGCKKGQDSLLQLITAMTNGGESDQIPRLSQDPDFLNSMYLKYHIRIPE